MTAAEDAALAAAVLDGVKQLLGVLESARAGTVSPANALNQIGAVQQSLLQNNVGADTALQQKFPNQP